MIEKYKILKEKLINDLLNSFINLYDNLLFEKSISFIEYQAYKHCLIDNYNTNNNSKYSYNIFNNEIGTNTSIDNKKN